MIVKVAWAPGGCTMHISKGPSGKQEGHNTKKLHGSVDLLGVLFGSSLIL